MEKSRPVIKLMEKQTFCEWYPDNHAAHQLEYKGAIGCLQYAAMISKSDICYAKGKFARYAENLSLIPWVGMKLILRYLSSMATMRLCLYNGGNKNGLVSYANTDYIGESKDSRSTSEMLINSKNYRVHWRSKSRLRLRHQRQRQKSMLWPWALWKPHTYGI